VVTIPIGRGDGGGGGGVRAMSCMEWKAGDRVGCKLVFDGVGDEAAAQCVYTLNGVAVGTFDLGPIGAAAACAKSYAPVVVCGRGNKLAFCKVADPPPPPPPTCTKGHLLVPCANTTSGWACDGMKAPGGCKWGCTGFSQLGGRERFTCPTCIFDLCGGCVAAGMVAAVHHLNLTDSLDAVYGSSAGSLIGAYLLSRQVRPGAAGWGGTQLPWGHLRANLFLRSAVVGAYLDPHTSREPKLPKVLLPPFPSQTRWAPTQPLDAFSSPPPATPAISPGLPPTAPPDIPAPPSAHPTLAAPFHLWTSHHPPYRTPATAAPFTTRSFPWPAAVSSTCATCCARSGWAPSASPPPVCATWSSVGWGCRC
jgi:hypothetical protein